MTVLQLQKGEAICAESGGRSRLFSWFFLLQCFPSPVRRRERALRRYTVYANDLDGPRGLVFGPSGELYVAEQSGGSVARIGTDGRVTRIAKGFSHPHDLAIDAKGTLYLAEFGADRVATISPAGVVATYIDKVPSPVDLDFSPQGELLVCELYKGRVVAFRDRQMVRVVASGLSWPHGLAFGKGGEIFINENTGNRINKLFRESRCNVSSKCSGRWAWRSVLPGICMWRSRRWARYRGSGRTVR